MKRLIGIMGALAVSFTVTLSTGRSVDLPFRKQVSARSKAEGLGGRALQLLERGSGRGRDVVFAEALGQFAPPGASSESDAKGIKIRSARDSILASASDWLLEVRGAGEWVRFRDHAYVTGPHNTPLATEARIAPSEVEAQARRVVEQELARYVKLGPGEVLRGYSVSYLVSVESNAGAVVSRSVYAAAAKLARVIDGVPVVGPGSNVTVLLANDGTLVGFDVDWVEFKRVGRTAATADIVTLRARQDALNGVKPGSQRPQEVDFECGYYDPGVWEGTPGALVEPACISVVDPAPGLGVLRRTVVPAKLEE